MCDDCRRAWDRNRGSRQDRGYGADHQAEHERIATLIRAGITIRHQGKLCFSQAGLFGYIDAIKTPNSFPYIFHSK
jgi:hypothetical protein